MEEQEEDGEPLERGGRNEGGGDSAGGIPRLESCAPPRMPARCVGRGRAERRGGRERGGRAEQDERQSRNKLNRLLDLERISSVCGELQLARVT